MQDHEIVALYWERNETAIAETEKKYGGYCYVIAYNVLYSHEDAEECVNDTYLRAWETMPPEKPSALNAYLGRITRNLKSIHPNTIVKIPRWKYGVLATNIAGI